MGTARGDAGCDEIQLFGAEGIDWVYGGGAARRDVAGQQRGGGQAYGDGDVCYGIDRAYAEQDGGHEAHQEERGDQAAADTDASEDQSVADEHSGDDFALGTERHADANFALTLRDRIGDHTVEAHDAEKQRHAAGDSDHDQRERSPGQRSIVEILKRVNAGERQIWIYGPDGRTDIFHQIFRACMRIANDVGNIATQHVLLPLEFLLAYPTPSLRLLFEYYPFLWDSIVTF